MASNSSASAVPASPYTPAIMATLPHDNAGSRLNASMWALICVSTPFLALRLYCKFLRHNGLWWDDYVLIGAWVSYGFLPSRLGIRAKQWPGLQSPSSLPCSRTLSPWATECTFGTTPSPLTV